MDDCNEDINHYFGRKARSSCTSMIEPKIHVQTKGCKCGYYVMHWMWCIVSGGLKNEWNKECLI
ncbi:hypothetical protein glysoja_022209 [Glycine soja]|nr:hypothetical protein glysoja_022209 [Glycine soja]